MADDTNTAERDALMDLIDAYAEARHVGGCHTYNAKTAEARAKVVASLAASAGSEPVAVYHGRCVIDCGEHGHLDMELLKMIPAGTKLYTHQSPPEGMAGWISVEDRLPEWAARDDTPCFINGKEVPPTLTSETVLVALQGGGVRTDKLTTIEGKSAGWWHTYGERVIAWQKPPAPPLPASEAKEPI